MPFTFDAFLAADPSNPSLVAANALVTIFDPADAAKTPVVLSSVSGAGLANPVQVNSNGFGPAFTHESLDRLGWEGGGFTGFFTSYEGLKSVAVAARDEAALSEQSARDSANLVNAPADTAVETLVNSTTSATRGALDATFARVVSGLVSDDATDNRAKIQAALDQGGHWIIPPTTGRYLVVDELDITVAGTTLDTTGAPLRQGTNGMALFNVTAPDVSLPDVDAVGMATKLDTTGMTATWEMSITASRWTVINAYRAAERLRIGRVRGSGFCSVVRVTNWDKTVGAVSTTRVPDVKIGDIRCSNVEFGFVVQGTDRFSCGQITGSYVYPIGGTRPPHLLYFSGTDDNNQDVICGPGVAAYEGGAGGQAYQFKGVTRGSVGVLQANGCPGAANLMDNKNLTIEAIESYGDTSTDAAGSVTLDSTVKQDGVNIGTVRVRMASDGKPFRQITGSNTRIGLIDVEVAHTTSGDANNHDVSVAGTNTNIDEVRIRNTGAANSWRGLGLWSGSGHRVGKLVASGVRVGLEVRSTATDAVVGYNPADVTLHATDGYQKTVIAAGAAPTLRLPGKPASTSLTKVLDLFDLGPESGTSFGPSISGHVWTAPVGSWVSGGGEAYESGSVTRSNAWVDTGAGNVTVQAAVKLKAYDGFLLRRVSDTEYLAAYLTTAGVVIAKWEAAALTTLASGPAATYMAGRWYDLKVKVFGTKIEVYVDGDFSVAHTLAAGDDTKFGTSTQHGLFCSASTGASRFKDFRASQL